MKVVVETIVSDEGIKTNITDSDWEEIWAVCADTLKESLDRANKIVHFWFSLSSEEWSPEHKTFCYLSKSDFLKFNLNCGEIPGDEVIRALIKKYNRGDIEID